ncbi:MAG: protein translocase subunit SecD [Bifidobacteriaceae bacterium]|jgi:preprotein translocase subunit SecD|nr:protein translocase subunit SecD [Bifidobacteriaceae bacterium]
MVKKVTKKSHPLRVLVFLLVVIFLLFGSVSIGAIQGIASFSPKLALDLAGGTEIVLTPKLNSGQQIDDNALSQAVEVIRQRIDSSGVSEAEITKQGTSNIVVGIPGESPSDETIDLISHAAQMRFRPVILYSPQTEVTQSSLKQLDLQLKSQSQTDDAAYKDNKLSINDGVYRSKNGLQVNQAEDSKKTDTKSDEQTKAEEAAKPLLTDEQKKDDKAKDTPSGYSEITNDIEKKFKELDCTKAENTKGGGGDDPEKVSVVCAKDGTGGKYILGPVAVEGNQIDKASSGLKAGQNGTYTNEWVVSLTLKSTGNQSFIDTTNRIKQLDPPRNQFAITLDSLVISAPSVKPSVAFTMGAPIEISGGSSNPFKQAQANNLANQLSFGALPMNFEVSSKDQISATLGSEQLQKGLLAGIIGLLLVILYSIFQYHILGFVAVGSLGVSAVLVYGTILLLSWLQGLTLSLASIIGLIVAIGVTADSFIVYFERIRDELRDGRTLDLAVSRGWKRAIRTILASDAVNFLAAAILYILAVGGVRGFAFMLGLTTLIDLVVVVLFTHPLVILLSKLRFFYEGHSISGLSPKRLGVSETSAWVRQTQEKDRRTLAEKKAGIVLSEIEAKAKSKADAKIDKKLAKKSKAGKKTKLSEKSVLAKLLKSVTKALNNVGKSIKKVVDSVKLTKVSTKSRTRKSVVKKPANKTKKGDK